MKLHLGCGKRFIPGYFHVDAVREPHVDLVSAVDSIPQAETASADVIYACHVLEHFHPRQVPSVLREWGRILRPGGTLRLAVPDLEALAHLYLETGDLALVRGPIWGRGDFLYNIHHTGFDERTLHAALVEAGFKNVRRYDWRQTEHATVDDYSQSYYPHMAHYPGGKLVERSEDVRGVLLSLNVEATK